MMDRHFIEKINGVTVVMYVTKRGFSLFINNMKITYVELIKKYEREGKFNLINKLYRIIKSYIKNKECIEMRSFMHP